MFKIAKGLLTIVAVAAIAVGATGAYFSSTATITNNTFSTGTLDIRVNGEPSVVGATFSPMAPDQIANSPQYEINNYGQPWFNGPSNLTAKKLILNVTNPNDFGSGLWDKVKIKVEVNRGWPAWQVAYDGDIKSLANVDLLNPNWTELIPGSSESFRYQVYLPDDGSDQGSLMGQTLTWNFAIEGRTN
jgi:predicted ribosomally synthesized peptide with SipW-like signal peptide